MDALGGRMMKRSGRDADALDFPVKLDAGIFLHAPAHNVAGNSVPEPFVD
jgi:hypothetical protein